MSATSNTFGSQQPKQLELALHLITSGHHYVVGKRPKGSNLFGKVITGASCEGDQFTVVTDKGSTTVTFTHLQILQGHGAGTIHLYDASLTDDDQTVLHIDRRQPNPDREAFERLVADAFQELGPDWQPRPTDGFLESL
ncbi:hypothetical protein PV379_04655 [Streptomyces caniscabiei]|uniref:hypothetical protein n=1 Tax=Streptomyces caniscabiei TaxID=2746961 RepID=UPI0029A6A028|nr:hypothetical protein [Streptomyces caniscabiei]MDX2776623.1 hypothetical protein [Streptomyces caniscabiei]